ncbi:hypothetical protein [Streptomyces sp. NRRL S-813]|uniref:hypothetical protein n=1 Tax=Streptomyces sp. NRRL S-813 TaxID=1463919 RepID=UPI0004C1FC0D
MGARRCDPSGPPDIDDDRDGCNTRQEVVKAEAVVAPVQGANCALTGGEWYSPYDDRLFDGPRGLDIDHLVSVPATI